MNENIKGRRHRGPSEKVNVSSEWRHTGQLHRCQGLLCDQDPAASLPSAGETVRVAIRRLLLVLLGERADIPQPRLTRSCGSTWTCSTPTMCGQGRRLTPRRTPCRRRPDRPGRAGRRRN